MRKIKVRIIGEENECTRILVLLEKTGRVKKIRKIDRRPVLKKYSRTFGSASWIYYVEMNKVKKH